MRRTSFVYFYAVACLLALGCGGSETSGDDAGFAGLSGGTATGATSGMQGAPGTSASSPGVAHTSGVEPGGQDPAQSDAGTTTGGTDPSSSSGGLTGAASTGVTGAGMGSGTSGGATDAGASGGGSDAGTSGADADAGVEGGAADAGADTGLPIDDEGCPPMQGAGGVQMRRVDDGVEVTGVGCRQQWEGIVMTSGGRGLCTAAFITERHLLSASHCYSSDGAVRLAVSAPTWDDGASHTFQANVVRSGRVESLDLSVIDLGEPVDWANPQRRYVLHAGTATSADLHVYGFGSGGSSGPAGTLRGVESRATIRVTNNGRGNLNGTAGDAQLCVGDSGGPAFVENTAAVLYGVNQAIVPSGWGGGRTCADTDWTIMFTNVSEYLPFIEESLGRTCERRQVDGLDVAQCW